MQAVVNIMVNDSQQHLTVRFHGINKNVTIIDLAPGATQEVFAPEKNC